MTTGAVRVDVAATSPDAFGRALRALSGEARAAHVAIAVAAPVAALTRVYAALEAPRACWAPPATGEWSFAAAGEVARIDTWGADRFAEARRRGSALLEGVDVRAVGSAAPPSPRLVGGFAFAPRCNAADVDHAPWADYPDASFALPRWLYAVRGSDAVLVLTLAAADLADAERWADRAQAVLQKIERLAAEPPSRRAVLPEVYTTAHYEPFVGSVEAALAAIRSRRFEKVVVSTDARLLADGDIDPALVLARLSDAYPETTRFALSRGATTFLGATPERLVVRHGRRIEIDALAGTVRRSARPEEDVALLRGLATSAKDLAEHGVVVRAIRDAVAPLCAELAISPEPAARTLRNVAHLWTLVRGTLRDERHVVELVERLHPTPAVAGFPREPAMAWLAEHEPAARGWYAGPVGWFDATGDGEFGVALRCGLLERRRAWVFAGAGIVEGSDPGRELLEVRTKQQAVLSALGVLP